MHCKTYLNENLFKCYSSGDGENDVLYVNGSDINRITAKLGKSGNAQYDVKLFVEYYDAEFCINSLFICDTIEQVETDD